MKLIDVDKLFEAMNERYNEKKDVVSDTLAEGFMQMDKLIHEQDVFNLAEHDKKICDEVISEAIHSLDNSRVECHEDYEDGICFAMGVLENMLQMKGEQNE